MMKKMRKVVALLLCVALVGGMLAGCGHQSLQTEEKLSCISVYRTPVSPPRSREPDARTGCMENPESPALCPCIYRTVSANPRIEV